MASLKVKSLEPSTKDKTLTPEDIKIVVDSWGIVRQNFKEVGFDLFICFFKNFPEYQKNFKSFENVPLNEIRGNKRVSAHANNVLYALSAVIDSIEDTEVFVEMVEKMTENHFRRKIRTTHFQNLGLVILEVLIDKLGPEVMNQQGIDAWKKTYLVLLGIVERVMDRKEAEVAAAKN